MFTLYSPRLEDRRAARNWLADAVEGPLTHLFAILLNEPEKGRVDIQLICDERIKPIETVETGEIEAAAG